MRIDELRMMAEDSADRGDVFAQRVLKWLNTHHGEIERVYARLAPSREPAELGNINRYCRAGMCVATDAKHEPGCNAHASAAPQPSGEPDFKRLELSRHGWVRPRADGVKARCGGPAVCAHCQGEQLLIAATPQAAPVAAAPVQAPPSVLFDARDEHYGR